jgi:Ser/Thr protein kinase RdoA (MazF antagonist)
VPTFPAQSSVLEERALREHLIREHQLPDTVTCRFASRGDADLYRVEKGSSRFYLKIYRPPRTAAATEAEVLLLEHLAGEGIPVARALRRCNGRFAHLLQAPEGDRAALLFETAPGQPLQLTGDLDRARAFGALVARLHAAADRAPPLPDLERLDAAEILDRIWPAVDVHLDDSQRQALAGVTEEVRRRLVRLPGSPPDHGPCHADLVASNVHVDGEGRMTFLDFGAAAYTWRAYELGVCDWMLQRDARRQGPHPAVRDALLEGYASSRLLPTGVPGELPTLYLCRQMAFLGGNAATLPLRLGTGPFEGDFIQTGVDLILRTAREAYA